MDGVSYREAIPSDLSDLVELTFLLAEETEMRVLDKGAVRSGLEKLIAGGIEGGKIFVAEAGPDGQKQLAGFLSVSGYEWSEWKSGLFAWFGSAYIREPFRKTGIGRYLYDMAVNYSKTRGVIGVRSYVRLDNNASIGAQLHVGLKLTGYVLMEDVFKPEDPAT